MDAIECIKGRRSIRSFTDEPVSHELLEEVIDVARFAPSWKNTQIARYIAVEGAKKEEVAANCFKAWVGNEEMVRKAPMVICLTYIKNRSGFERDGSFSTSKEDRWQNFDAGIAAQTFCLAAHEKGLGTVILGIFDEHEAERVLEIPEDRGVAAFIVIGHHEGNPEAPKRKEVSDLVSYFS